MQTEFVGCFDVELSAQAAEASALADQPAVRPPVFTGIVPGFVQDCTGSGYAAVDQRRSGMGRTVRVCNEGKEGRARGMRFSQSFSNGGDAEIDGVEAVSDMHGACISELTINVGHQVRVS